jgi:hypothetical protein
MHFETTRGDAFTIENDVYVFPRRSERTSEVCNLAGLDEHRRPP